MITASPNPFTQRINVQLNSIIYITGNPPQEAGFLFEGRNDPKNYFIASAAWQSHGSVAALCSYGIASSFRLIMT